MNQFEKNVQSKRNDAIDSGMGFAVSFGFFAVLFIIATVIKVVGS
ncbi:YqzM family protein [Bacillus sp. FJAT-29790]|nr:YqzM family protein [Bacillus sp. FJAT-29790]